MTSYLQSSFALQTKTNFDFLQQPLDSDSENEELGSQQKILQPIPKEIKKQKKMIDIDLIKSEMLLRPLTENTNPETYYRRYSRKSIRTLNDLILPTSTVLIEQLSQVKKIKEIRKEVPPELMGKIFSEFRYQSVPQLTPVYRQGDQNKRFYIILEGKVVVMKPKEKMVGSSKLTFDEAYAVKQVKRTEQDPYGLNNIFPEYIVLKVLFSGDSFGEAAIKLDTARSSTVVALEQTHLIYMSETAYLELIDPYLSVILDDKILYFSKTPLFQSIDPTEFMGIILECKMITYNAGEVIYDEGDKPIYIYFIISGEIELSKQVKDKSVVLSSYGQFQSFGDVEIMLKLDRFTKSKVLSPKVHVYRIRKRKFFDNLGNYSIYETMKKYSNIIYKHWQQRCDNAQDSINPKDEILSAAQDVLLNKPNRQAKYILNKKIVESQGVKLNQVKAFQSVTEESFQNPSQIPASNQHILQRVYSNTLQQYQARLLKKPQVIQTQCDDSCIRKPLILTSTSNQLQIDNTTNNDTYELNSITSRSSQPQLKTENTYSSHVKLPSLHTHPHSLNNVLDSISKLPRVQRDNLVLSLMYQQAFKSEDPQKKAKQIQKVIQASYRNVQMQFQPKPHHRKEANSLSTDRNSMKFKSSGADELQTTRSNYVSFVQQKQLCSQLN